ncbi:MAG: ApbE family lipoprotein, partial [Verrucomicrobiaceae bacterium]|nr:ApbE family lipoprotein [Verrucomicrobiaceae bacterium]
FEARYSRYREDSLISAINRAAGAGWVDTDAELESLFALCDHHHWSTGGVFEPTALPLQRLWNYQAAQPRVPGDDEIAQALKQVGWDKVLRRPGKVCLPEAGMAIDLGGIGKEYAVDRVIEQSRPFGITDILVDFGRDVRASGQAPQGGPWRVGLEHPAEVGRCWGGVQASNRAVTTSGDYLRGFEVGGRRYSHIIDPRTGRPVANGCHSASVIAPTCTEAGVLSTAALILGAEEGVRLIERSCLAQGCVWQGDALHETQRFAACLV